MTCKCQSCNQQYSIDIIIDNNLWDKIKPANKSEESGLFCGRCIVKKIESLSSGYTAFQLEEITNE